MNSWFGNVPTDSLYKFMAISGLVVLGFSFAFVYWDTKSLDTRIEKLRLDVNVEAARQEDFQKRIKLISFLVINSIRKNGDDELINVAQLFPAISELMGSEEELALSETATFDSPKEIRNALEGLINLRDDGTARVAQLETRAERIKELTQDTEQTIEFGAIWSLIGFSLSAAGFGLWYSKLQRWTDLSLVGGRKRTISRRHWDFRRRQR